MESAIRMRAPVPPTVKEYQGMTDSPGTQLANGAPDPSLTGLR